MGISKGHFDFVGITQLMLGTRYSSPDFLRSMSGRTIANCGLDPLYTHPQAQTFLRGALVASAYPMSGAGQEQAADLARGDQTRLEFASDDCQGIYQCGDNFASLRSIDANPDQLIHRWLPSLRKLLSDRSVKLFHMRVLLTMTPLRIPATALIGYDYEEFVNDTTQNSDKADQGPRGFASCQPQIWITVVGNDGYWPLAYRSVRMAADRYAKDFPAADQESHDTAQSGALAGNSSDYTFIAWTPPAPIRTSPPKAQNLSRRRGCGRILTPQIGRFLFVFAFGLFEIVQYFRRRSYWSNSICGSLHTGQPDSAIDRIENEGRVWCLRWVGVGPLSPVCVSSFCAHSLLGI